MTTTIVCEPVQAKVDAFAERLVGILTDAGMGLMLSIGHRTGLFDAMAELPPLTSESIAKHAGLNERYVREWLGAMVTGGIVEYDPADQTYVLPSEHATLLTRTGKPANFAATMQWLSVLGGVEDNIVDCFRNGGGVCYEKFHRFHEVMAEESAQTVVAALRDHILPLIDGLADKLESGIDVVDIGCGSGRAVCLMAADFPNSRFAGYDLCEDAVAAARNQAQREGLQNVRFEIRDVSRLGESAKFDLITAFDAIHDQARPQVVLHQIVTALRPGGTFLMQDILASSWLEKNIGNPLAPFLYTISTMHCMSVSLAQDGAGLGTCWGRELAESMLREAGLVDIRVEKLPHDDMNYYYIARKPAQAAWRKFVTDEPIDREALARKFPDIPIEWLIEFEAARQRTLEERLRYAFIKTYKPVMDDEPFRAWDTTADYRHWCEENLPRWLGYGPADAADVAKPDEPNN